MTSAVSSHAKASIQRHLAKQTGQKQFAPGMDLNLPQQVATLRRNVTVLEQRAKAIRASLRDGTPSTTLETELRETERVGETACAELARKQEELSHEDDTYIRRVRQQMTEVRNYRTMYRIVGEQLATADALLADSDRARQRIGLRLAREACGHMNSGGTDVWLAARICEAYFWPNLDLADADASSRENALDLLETARRVFFETDETNNVLRNYGLLLSNAPNPRAADTFRVQVADWLEEKGSLKQAAAILDEICDVEVLASAQERITRVRERAANVP